jgi:hypothetical protein
MKKVFGIILMIVGAIWGLLMFFVAIDSFDEFGMFVLMIFLAALGVGLAAAGLFMVKSKKAAVAATGYDQAGPVNNGMAQQTQANSADGYTQQQQQASGAAAPNPAQNENPEQLALKEIEALVEQKLSGIPHYGTTISSEQVKQVFYSLNDPKSPFAFMASQKKNVDIEAVWRVADVQYLDLIGLHKQNKQEEFSVLMKFDEAKGVLRCIDKHKAKSSGFGLGGGGMQFSTFKGKSSVKKKEVAFGRRADGSLGKIYTIQLDTSILINAIKQVTEKSGWEMKRIAAGSL